LLKTFIWVFAVCVFIQGVALALRGYMFLTGQVDEYRTTPQGVAAAGH
jgi:hypothetical protein